MTTVFRSEGHTGLSEVSSKHIQPHRGNLLKTLQSGIECNVCNVMEAPSNNQILSDLRMEGTPWKTRRGPGPACESGMHLKFRWFRPKL